MQEYKPTILVVDDTEDNLDLLEFALKRKPVSMLRASSGRECLIVAEDKQPDIILLDIQMPEMDGFETLKKLRSNRATAKIPVIFLTAARKDPDSIATGLALGAEQYLTKPIDTEELLAADQDDGAIEAGGSRVGANKSRFYGHVGPRPAKPTDRDQKRHRTASRCGEREHAQR